MNPVQSAQLMLAVCDTLLPGDDLYPAASLTGMHGVVAHRLRERYGNGIFAELAADLEVDGLAFADRSGEERVDALRRLESSNPLFFAYLLMSAYLAYYATPPVIEAIRLEGHIYNDAPLPLGYDLTPFSFTPGVDVPAQPKGWFKSTAEVERLDLSGLADLDLPVQQETSR